MNSLLVLLALVSVDPSSPEWRGSKEEAAALAQDAKEQASGIKFVWLQHELIQAKVGEKVVLKLKILSTDLRKFDKAKMLMIWNLQNTPTREGREIKLGNISKEMELTQTIVFTKAGMWLVRIGLVDPEAKQWISHGLRGVLILDK